MCERCREAAEEYRAKTAVRALEALANGEEPPEPSAPEVPDGITAFPLKIMRLEDGMIAFVTDRTGGVVIASILSAVGTSVELPPE